MNVALRWFGPQSRNTYKVRKQNKNGTPVSREAQAMCDIEAQTGIRPTLAPYNNVEPSVYIPVTPDVPVGGDLPTEVDPIP